MLHIAPDPAEEAEHAIDGLLRKVSVATPDNIERVKQALDAYVEKGQSVAALVVRLAAERNSLRAQLNEARETSSLYSDNDGEEEEALDDDDFIAMAAMPSRRQVRKSILSVLSVNVNKDNNDAGSLNSSYILGAVTTTPIAPRPSGSFAVTPRGSSKAPGPLSPITPSSPDNITPPSPSHASADLPSPSPSNQLRQARPSSSSIESTNLLVIPKRGQSTAASARLSTAIPLDSMSAISEEAETHVDSPTTTPPITARGSSATENSVPATAVANAVTRDSSSNSLDSTGNVGLVVPEVYLEGYLVKKMNNTPFASEGGTGWGWKSRYFKLKERELEEYDGKTLQKLSTIQLKYNTLVSSLQSGPQNSSAGTAHAFTLTEHKHSMPAPINIRHTLCTHAQAERDAWVEAINARIQAISSAPSGGVRRMRRPSEGHLKVDRSESLESTSPKLTPQQLQLAQMLTQGAPVGASGPGSAGHGNNRTAINLLQEGGSAAVGVARRGFNMFLGGGPKKKADSPRIVDPDRAIFGAPLEKGVTNSQLDPEIQLSSVVSRCIEYLEEKDGIKEEGIYRLSGATTQIQGLKTQFDLDGDLNLLRLGETEILDFHAVAGLLKLYLRELPDSILGDGDLKKEFLKCANLAERGDKVKELTRLLPQLPSANFTLLKRLSVHLNLVIQYHTVNKMTMSNLSIVFSPTLGVPGGLFQVMVLDHEAVFGL
ncbi:UNVERIFIED_CONTAM: hypothetical protein HDU68_003088 [Siphonaria sp. JEL0065]|nr:hypothetical protein HDU68_003088 [Siphonaria sp. JEL0065]